jgi:hypothetical protein
VRSRCCRRSTTALTECWSGQHTSSWRIEPTRCPHSARKRSGHQLIRSPPSRRAGVATVRAPLPKQRGRPRQVTFSLLPTVLRHQQLHLLHQHPAARYATPCRQTDSTSEPAAAEFGGDLWWRTVCSYYVSRHDRHMTCYTLHMLYICTVHTRPSLPILKNTVVARLLTCLHLHILLKSKRSEFSVLKNFDIKANRTISPTSPMWSFRFGKPLCSCCASTISSVQCRLSKGWRSANKFSRSLCGLF